ncbi:MAG: AEC family transporter [Geminicoccaceae bacterium]|nr:AEC family transporter [Geminicoccaceae bacterium]MCS7269112.1 AEC family transporter [Geminicoccaceae bacterium]MCX7629297.1 AEC family transporter [Geminicoccaceae bacterium]MDW8125791.1 AEC family transporter [Geminicoccaceae bacterium]MDW8342658.1 AEC family transporter [Geminicoccaceae bacterium]
MDAVASSLLVVALLVALGTLLRRSGIFPAASWAPIERLTYFVLFPALIVVELAKADLGGSAAISIALALVGAQLVMFALAFPLRRVLRLDGPRFGCLVQGFVRWNSYTALALAPLLFGPEALGLAAIAVGSLTPVANLLSVWALARHAPPGAPRPSLSRALASNPLLLACALGLAWNLLDLPLLRLVVEPLSILGRATLALGLLAVGAGLEPVRRVADVALLAIAAAGRLVLEPLVAIGLGRWFGLEGTALGVVALCAAVPTASSAYILARLMGGDAELTAAIVTVNTVLAVATLPAILALVI